MINDQQKQMVSHEPYYMNYSWKNVKGCFIKEKKWQNLKFMSYILSWKQKTKIEYGFEENCIKKRVQFNCHRDNKFVKKYNKGITNIRSCIVELPVKYFIK